MLRPRVNDFRSLSRLAFASSLSGVLLGSSMGAQSADGVNAARKADGRQRSQQPQSGSATNVGQGRAGPGSSAGSKWTAAGRTISRTGLVTPAATSTIFWALDKRGVLVLSDRPAVQGSQAGQQTFAASTDAASLAKAQRERDYWRAQADQFSSRQRERERELEAARRLRFLDSRNSERDYYLGAPIYARGVEWWSGRNAPLVGGFAVPTQYSTSPGAVPSGATSFIGSGFSRSSGR